MIPFKFLDSYTLDDKDIFFGREKETEEIHSRLFYSKLLLIYGPSGSGKTSLLQCGVSDRMGGHNWKPVFIRRRQNILESIHAELDRQAITPFKKEKSIPDKLYSLYLDYLTPLYLIFDQFEELFIFGESEEKTEWVCVLKDILSREDLNTQIILSIREEYLASLSDFEDELPQLFENRIRIEKMKKAQALSVIISPCEVCHVSLEKGLAETAVEKIISESATIELTWLQVLMDRLYKLAISRNEENVEITLADLESLGNIGDVLGNFLEEQLQLVPDPEKGDAVLKTLISSEGTKRQLSLSEIKEALVVNGHNLEPDDILPIVRHFVTVRILSDKDENDRYELKHDSLAAKIFQRLTLAERELQEARQFVENAYKSYLRTDHLLGRKELSYISKFEDKLFLKGETDAFLNTSKQNLRKRSKAQKRVKRYSIISLVFLCINLCMWTCKEKREYEYDKDALSALLRKVDDPEKSLLNAIYSYNGYKSPLTRKALYETFYNLWNIDSLKDSTGKNYSPYHRVFDFKPCKSEILFADYSADGTCIYGYLADNTIMIWSQWGKELFQYRLSDQPVLQLKMSPDNKLLSCFYADSTACLSTFTGKVLLQTKICYDLINPSRVMAFSPDSKKVAYSVPGNKVQVYNTDGRPFQTLENHEKEVTAIAFSNNGQFLATASKDHSIVLYYFNHNKGFFDVYNIIKGHKDIVWSVEFAKNNKYVISSSEDSTVRVWNFSGKDVLPKYFENNRNLVLFNRMKAKFSDAFLSKLEDYLIIKHMDSVGTCSGRIDWLTTISVSSTVPHDDSIIRIVNVKFLSSGIIYTTASGTTNFLSHAMRIYYSFPDHFKMVSSNGSYLFGIDHNILKFYPLTEKEILRLTVQKKIFGNLVIHENAFNDNLYSF
ncbi:MAG: hypothetical protein NTU44_16460 [Bacteroidetes bacterium]|nr:hypothetical protein [Bacteroidota bacterium]